MFHVKPKKECINKPLLSLCLSGLLAAAMPLQAETWEQGYALLEQGKVEQALKIWQTLAEQGDSASQLTLGKAKMKGSFGSIDKNRAFYWFDKAARQGNAEGQYMLAALYLELHNDFDQARRWLQQSARGGFSLAETLLSELDDMQKNPQAYSQQVDIRDQQGFVTYYGRVAAMMCKNQVYLSCVTADAQQCSDAMPKIVAQCFIQTRDEVFSREQEINESQLNRYVGSCIQRQYLQLKGISAEQYAQCFTQQHRVQESTE